MRLANANGDRAGDRVAVAVRLDVDSSAARIRLDVGGGVLVPARHRVGGAGLDVLTTGACNGDEIDPAAIGRCRR